MFQQNMLNSDCHYWSERCFWFQHSRKSRFGGLPSHRYCLEMTLLGYFRSVQTIVNKNMFTLAWNKSGIRTRECELPCRPPRPWSCLVVRGDEDCNDQSGKLLCLFKSQNYEAHARHHSMYVWLLGWSGCSSPSTR